MNQPPRCLVLKKRPIDGAGATIETTEATPVNDTEATIGAFEATTCETETPTDAVAEVVESLVKCVVSEMDAEGVKSDVYWGDSDLLGFVERNRSPISVDRVLFFGAGKFFSRPEG